MFPPVREQIERIRAGTVEILPEDALADKLERSRQADRPLVVKQGFDPTRPDLHIGHAVSLRKLRDFQELGHQVVFVIGDFTARVGDPSGRSDTRPVLTEEDIEANLATYREQVFRVLDPERTLLRRNSEWLAGLDLADVLRLSAKITVARILERDDFAVRYQDGRPISLVELLYPLMQGYDSVELHADVELGGTDQKFNLLVGRALQERSGQEPQVCVILPLLRGTDGQRKMSKSYDNAVGLAMEPADMFGRTMSIPDSLLDEWIRLASGAAPDEIARRLEQAVGDPLSAKRWLAEALVAAYQNDAAAAAAREAFDRVHRRREVPEEVRSVQLDLGSGESALWLPHAMVQSTLARSNSEAVRLIEQGAVRVDGELATDRERVLEAGEHLLQRGKRSFVRVRVGR